MLAGGARPGQCPSFTDRARATGRPLPALGLPCTSSEAALLPAPPRDVLSTRAPEKACLRSQLQFFPGPCCPIALKLSRGPRLLRSPKQ